MSKVRYFLRLAFPGPVRRGKLALVTLTRHGEPETGAWVPVRALRLFGGRRWSVTVVIREDTAMYRTRRGPVDREDVEEALDLLTSEHADTDQAIELLRGALRHR